MNPVRFNSGLRREVLREEMVMKERVLALLKDGPKTVPAVAAVLGRPTDQVMLWMMGLRRYGLIVEQGRPNTDGYFNYVLKAGKTA